MFVEVDNKSGFCYGVQKTIKLAEDALAEGKPVHCLGEIVHNDEEVDRLKSKGLVVITHDELKDLHHSNILFRAHGEPPSTYQTVDKNANVLADGTCPIVLKLQKRVLERWTDMKHQQGQVVIYGKKGHAEVNGLVGQTEGQAIIIDSISDLAQVDCSKPVALFAQTTQSPAGYEQIAGILREKMASFFEADKVPLYVSNSICGYVSKRGEHLAEFSGNHEVIIFVSGSKSSNGKVLLDICIKNNPHTYWVQNPEDLNPEWFNGVATVGICGATSTPQWLMESIAQKIKDNNFKK